MTDAKLNDTIKLGEGAYTIDLTLKSNALTAGQGTSEQAVVTADKSDAANTGSAKINYLDIKGFNKDDKIIIKDTTVIQSGEKLIAADEYKITKSSGDATKGDRAH